MSLHFTHNFQMGRTNPIRSFLVQLETQLGPLICVQLVTFSYVRPNELGLNEPIRLGLARYSFRTYDKQAQEGKRTPMASPSSLSPPDVPMELHVVNRKKLLGSFRDHLSLSSRALHGFVFLQVRDFLYSDYCLTVSVNFDYYLSTFI